MSNREQNGPEVLPSVEMYPQTAQHDSVFPPTPPGLGHWIRNLWSHSDVTGKPICSNYITTGLFREDAKSCKKDNVQAVPVLAFDADLADFVADSASKEKLAAIHAEHASKVFKSKNSSSWSDDRRHLKTPATLF